MKMLSSVKNRFCTLLRFPLRVYLHVYILIIRVIFDCDRDEDEFDRLHDNHYLHIEQFNALYEDN